MITSLTSSDLIPPNHLFTMSSVASSHTLISLSSSSLLSQAASLDYNSSVGLKEKTVVPKMDSMLPLSPLPLLWGSSNNQSGGLATEVLSVGSSSTASIVWSEQTSPAASSSTSSSSASSSYPTKERRSIKDHSKSTIREDDREKDKQAVIRHHQKKQEYLDRARLEQLEQIVQDLKKENAEVRKENAQLNSRNTQLHSLNAEFLAIHTQLNSINAQLIAMNIRLLAQARGLTYREQYYRVVNFLSALQRLR